MSQVPCSNSQKRGRSVRGFEAAKAYDVEPLDVDFWDEETLKDAQEASGAVFEGEDGQGAVPCRFAADSEVTYEELAGSSACAFCDRSDAAVLQIGGADRLSFLHNQTTATVDTALAGDVLETAIVTAKAQMVDLVTLFVQESSVLLVGSPGNAAALASHFDKHVFRNDDVKITDLSGRLSVFALLGGGSSGVLKQVGMGQQEMRENAQVLMNFEGYPLCVARHSGLSLPGYTWIVDSNIAVEAWKLLADKLKVRPVGSQAFERLRVRDGKPALGEGKELSPEHNPLEAGLFHCLDVEKGCSIGQEVIKRIHAKNGILRRLWVLEAKGRMQQGSDIIWNERKVGAVTSVCEDGGGKGLALGYLKMYLNREVFAAEGQTVSVGGVSAVVRPASYAQYPEQQEAEEEALPEDDSEEDEKRRKKAEMKARMEEWLKQSKESN